MTKLFELDIEDWLTILYSLRMRMRTSSDVQIINHQEFCGHGATLYMQALLCPSFFLFKLI